MALIIALITFCYVFLIGSFIYGFDVVESKSLKNSIKQTTFTVIIPFRNEAANLPELLQSLKDLSYPKSLYEIVFVDDDSDDNSEEIIRTAIQGSEIDFCIIPNVRQSKSPKKDAITEAVKKSKFQWIITTDADCIIPKQWLACFDEFIQDKNAKCIAAPVGFLESHSFLNNFQILDMLSLQGATIGAFGVNKPFLCNGANFGYQKAVFNELNGFSGNNTVASGDDIFLLEKCVERFPNKTFYLKNKNAIVYTKAPFTWKELMQQRLRWASKAKAYRFWFSKLTGVLVFLMNLLCVFLLICCLFNSVFWKVSLGIFLTKALVDFILIYKSAVFFSQKKPLKSYWLSMLIYPFFVFFVVLSAQFKNYHWKGRSFKR